ncbi:MAG TPA: tetratricopeptide repeat protein [candidate division Zixibacteria bacterium]|nr:tetratricopeptide repeat protein [candidate division Zixibacteria bacterium]
MIEIDSACSLAYRNLAVCETRLNNFENAYRVLTDYLELAGEDYNLIVMAAEIAANLQKFDEAIKYGERALEINPHSPQLLTLLGDCYYSGGFLVSAKMSFEQALKIDPNFDPARQRILQINEIQDARKR